MQKPDFSVAEAFSAGVALIERSFKSVLAWAGAMFVLTLIPAFAAFVVLGGKLVLPTGGTDLIGVDHLESGLATAQHPQSLGVVLIYALLGVVWLIVETAVIYAAIFRTVWAGKAGRFGNLRLGAAEAWLSLLFVVQVIALVILVLAARLVGVAVTYTAILAGPQIGRWIALIGAVAIWAVALWIVLRLCLSQPMTVAERRFRFFESWGLTSGRSWKLFWTFGLVLALIVGLEAIYLVLVAAGVELLFGVRVAATELKSLHLEPIAGFAIPIGLFWLAFGSFIGALLRALLLAPLASAYQGLSRST